MQLNQDQAEKADRTNNPQRENRGAGDGYDDRHIPLDLIDEPSLPERETMEETELAELALDIMTIGLTNPITVFQRGDRYETIAGHRRLLACRLAGYSPVPCRVKQGANIDPLAILVSENEHREPVNPVHQGRFYQRVLVERAGNDVDKLCAIVKRRRELVEDRLILIQQHPAIVAAVESKKISLAVARELTKCRDENRLVLLLDVAIQSGATAKQIAEWRQQGAELGDVQVPPADAENTAPPAVPYVDHNPMTCVLCMGAEYPHLMEMLWVHGPCRTMLMRMLSRSDQPAGEVGG